MVFVSDFVRKYSERYASRWLVLFIDVLIVAFAFFVALAIRYSFDFVFIDFQSIDEDLALTVGIYLVFFLIFQSYVGIIRHTSLYDTVKIIQSSSVSVVVLYLISYFYNMVEGYYIIPLSIVLIHFLICTFMMISSRILFKAVFISLIGSKEEKERRNVMIYGAGKSGLITMNTLIQDSSLKYQIVGFIDDNPYKVGKTLAGIKIYSSEEGLDLLIKRKKIDEVIISIQNISSSRKRDIVNAFLDLDVLVKNVPPIEKWINGELSARQIKQIKIEDILHREPIKLDNKNVISEIHGKSILITGAAGSIGSEITRQVLLYSPSKVTVVDQAETPMFELEHFLRQSKALMSKDVSFVIADVQDETAMRRVFRQVKPEIVFHAAAYKHVPIMENNPFEAIRVNVFGTRLMADLSIEFGVEKFIMVSTDKAVNPTNVMGASKRVAEIYIQSLNTIAQVRTSFITTRFGNVLGSNGSVIPLFKKQIEAGGPVTVTHPEITRYFMTIPEACQLVLEAGAMGKGGEIFIFDMGESVRIIDVAKNMIKMYGLKIGQDIQIEITGLRPGEKLYEELLNDKENTLPTHHPKIMIAQVQPQCYEDVIEGLEGLKTCYDDGNDLHLVGCIKSIVKEYVSNNSIYQSLDS